MWSDRSIWLLAALRGTAVGMLLLGVSGMGLAQAETELPPAVASAVVSNVGSSKAGAPLVGQVSLTEALTLAERYNPQLQVARENLRQAQANVSIARQVPNPQMEMIYGFGPTTVKLGNAQQVLLSQTLELGGKRRARTVLANSQYVLAQAQLADLKQDIRAEVRLAYAELLAAEESAANLIQQEQLLLELVQIARKRFLAGAAAESEVIQATLSHDQVIPLQAKAAGQIRQARVELNTLVGKSLPPQFTIMPQGGLLKARVEHVENPLETLSLELPSLASLQARAQQNRYDLQAAIRQVGVSHHQLEVTRSLRVPDLQVGAGYQFLKASGQFWQGAVTTVGVTLPIYNNHKAEIRRDEAAIQQNEHSVVVLRQQIENDVEKAYIALQTALVNTRLYEEKLLPAAEELAKLAKLNYQVGKTGLANVILAQQSVQEVRSGYLDALIEHQKSVATLEKAIGGSLED